MTKRGNVKDRMRAQVRAAPPQMRLEPHEVDRHAARYRAREIVEDHRPAIAGQRTAVMLIGIVVD